MFQMPSAAAPPHSPTIITTIVIVLVIILLLKLLADDQPTRRNHGGRWVHLPDTCDGWRFGRHRPRGSLMSPFLAGVIVFLAVGGLLLFVSSNQTGAIVSQAFLGTAIVLLLLQDSDDLQAGSQKVLGALEISSEPPVKAGKLR